MALRIKSHFNEKTATESQAQCGWCLKPVINGLCGCIEKIKINPGRRQGP